MVGPNCTIITTKKTDNPRVKVQAFTLQSFIDVALDNSARAKGLLIIHTFASSSRANIKGLFTPSRTKPWPFQMPPKVFLHDSFGLSGVHPNLRHV
jgi:hypothetical protein